MTGVEEYNFPEFDRVANMLKTKFGCEVINPAEVDRATAYEGVTESLSHDALTRHFVMLNTVSIMACTGIVMLHGFGTSHGALHELSLARRLGLDVYVLQDLE